MNLDETSGLHYNNGLLPLDREQLWDQFEKSIEALRATLNHDGYTFNVKWKIEDMNRKKKARMKI